MSEDPEKGDEPAVERRRVLKKAMAGGIVGAALLPEHWMRPVVDSVIVPAHAQTSPAQTTSTTGLPGTTGTTIPGTTGVPTTIPGTTGVPPTTILGTTGVPPTTILGTTGIPSDVRLKHDIEFVGRLESGLGLYRYRYLWSDVEYVGVLAQEVADVAPDAVVRGNDGYLRVRYGQLGLSLMTWEQWLASTQVH